MSTLETTLSMLKGLPEEDQQKVLRYTKQLYDSENQSDPFRPVTIEDVIADLEISRKEIAEGKGLDMDEALKEMGQKYGFI